MTIKNARDDELDYTKEILKTLDPGVAWAAAGR